MTSITQPALGPLSWDPLDERGWNQLAADLNLSPRELEIVRAIVTNDASTSALAETPRMAPDTVRTHLKRLYRKLSVSSQVGMTVRVFHWCFTHGSWRDPDQTSHGSARQNSSPR